jgi:hypothetical protein
MDMLAGWADYVDMVNEKYNPKHHHPDVVKPPYETELDKIADLYQKAGQFALLDEVDPNLIRQFLLEQVLPLLCSKD